MSRRRSRTAARPKTRTRAEVVTAVVTSVALAMGTGLAVWAMRPGGIADRQPRASWLVGTAVLAAALLLVRVTRRPPRRASARVASAGGLAVVALGAVVAGVLWPGGLLRHSPRDPFAAATTTVGPTTSAVPGATTTSAPEATTTSAAPDASTTSAAATTVP
jgi:hypothetical protein